MGPSDSGRHPIAQPPRAETPVPHATTRDTPRPCERRGSGYALSTMTDFLFYGDTASNLERNRVAAAAPDAVIHDIADLGFYELLGSGLTFYEIDLELASRAVAAMGVREAIVDPEMQVEVADRLRADSVVLHPTRRPSRPGAGASRRPSSPASAGRRSRRMPACVPPPSCCASRSQGRPPRASGRGRDRRGGPRCAPRRLPAPRGAGEPRRDRGLRLAGYRPRPRFGPLPANLPIVIDLWPQDEASGAGPT